MSSVIPRRYFPTFAALFAMGVAASAAPINFAGTSAYTQDFQSMTGAAISTSSVAGSTMTEISTLSGGSAGVAGWYMYGLGWTTAANKWLGADNGGSNTGGFRQLIDTASPVVGRALGSEGSGTAYGFFGLVLKNTSGATINTVSISYDAVMNRNPSTTANQYLFGYLVSSTAVSTSTTASAAGTFSATLNSSTLGFTTPSTGTGAPGTQAAITPLFKIGTMSGNLSTLSWGADQYLYLAWKEVDQGGSDANAGVDNFSLSVPAAVRNLTWRLLVAGTWDASTANFTSSGSNTAYVAGDNVTFDKVEGGVITLSGALAPSSVTVSAASGTYTFTGPTSGDKITGSTSIAKSGAGTLILNSDNDFSGGVTVTGGTVQIDGAGRLGTGGISLNGAGATLASTALSSLGMSTNALSIGASGGTINAGSAGMTLGALTSSGLLTKTGAGSLTLGTVGNSAGAGFTVSAGDLVFGQASGIVKIFANTSLTGNLVLSSGIRFDVDDGSTISGAGKIKVAAKGALISNTSGNIGGTISSEIALNSGNLTFAKGSWVGSVYTPSTDFLTTVGGTTGGALIISLMSGDSDVDLSNNSTTGGGTGALTLTGASTYTGNTTINANTPTSPAVSIILGVDNALPVGTGLIVGTKTGVGVPVLDLNGKNQQLAYLSDGANVTAGKYLKIVNNNSAWSVLTLGGSISPGNPFSGYISDGVGIISLVKTGANTQTLSGFGAYSGGVTVNAGTLKVIPPAGASISDALGTGVVIVGGTGQIFVAATIANAITVNSGGRLSGNGQVDAVRVNAVGVIATNTTIGQMNAATLTMGGTATMEGSAIIEWKVNDANAAAGIGYDTFNFSTGLDLSNASIANKIVVRIISFNSPGDVVAGQPLSLSRLGSHPFDFATASSVTKPSLGTNIADLFTYDVSQFQYSDGSLSNAAFWAMSYDETSGAMTLTAAVPEPSTYGLGLGALLLAVAAIRRRRRRAIA